MHCPHQGVDYQEMIGKIFSSPDLIEALSVLRKDTQGMDDEGISYKISSSLCRVLSENSLYMILQESQQQQIFSGLSHAIMALDNIIRVYITLSRGLVPMYDQIKGVVVMLMQHSFVDHYTSHVLLTSLAADVPEYLDEYYQRDISSLKNYFFARYEASYKRSYQADHFDIDDRGVLCIKGNDVRDMLYVQSGQCPALAATHTHGSESLKHGVIKTLVEKIIECYKKM